MIQTKYGLVEGVQKDGCTVYMGIPFAKPPVGASLFLHPEEPEAWDGVLKADHGSHNPIQTKGRFSFKNTDPDCLYMNIFVPDQEQKTDLPVMVWIYGGSYETGGSGAKEEGSQNLHYDLSLFARETKTIVVSFNYRLNLSGFLNLHSLDEKCDQNNGLYDQLMALRFIQDNIAAFGGDPDNVTIFGQSAGGACVLALMSMEEGKGLFHKAISQSPCVEHFFTEEESRRNARIYLRKAKVLELSELKGRSWAQISEINRQFSSSFTKRGELRCAFSPVIDGVTLKEAPATAAPKSGIPLLIGNVKEEGNLFVPANVPGVVVPFAAGWFHLHLKEEKASYSQRFSDTLTEHVYTRPIEELLKRCSGPSWRYEFQYAAPGSKYGCCHICDLPVLFGTYTTLDGIYDPEAEPVGNRMRQIWGDFARSGNPGWKPYNENQETFIIS